MSSSQKKQVAIWLGIIVFLIFSMVIIGGITRLTHSGLSMVEWKPLMGIIPPTNEQSWMEVFDKYKAYPEFKILNKHMELSEFKFIFYWEYFHRLLGRTIGVAFLFPFLFFYFKKYFDKKLATRVFIGFLLGGLQGLLGWFMVKSGLVDNPHVSHYRLAAHLSVAFGIAAYLLWLIFDILLGDETNPGPHRRFAMSVYITAGICIQIVFGAFVAGKKAGFGYNTFPMMDDHWIPPEAFALHPVWKNFFETNAAIQFAHRTIAWILLIAIIGLLIKFKGEFIETYQKRARHFLLSMIGIQFFLGVMTILFIGDHPVALPSIHQAGAFVLFSSAIFLNYTLKKNK